MQHLIQHRLVRFLLAGGSGAALNLVITGILTHFLLGDARYFEAFLIGTAANMVYNFTLYTVAVFKTHTYHVRRFFAFVLYSIAMTIVQLWLVHRITDLIGTSLYLVVIVGVIGGGALVNYLVFKTSLFRTREDNEA